MVSFYNYNPEKKLTSFADLYLMAFFAAFVLVFVLVVSGYGIRWLIAFVIKYYLWVFGVLAVIAVVRHLWTKDKRRPEICEYR